MKSILEALYDGKLYPAEQSFPKSEEYHRISRAHSQHQRDFSDALRKLDPSLVQQFDTIIEEENEDMSYELTDMFISGFRLGARIIIDVFQGELYQEKTELTP